MYINKFQIAHYIHELLQAPTTIMNTNNYYEYCKKIHRGRWYIMKIISRIEYEVLKLDNSLPALACLGPNSYTSFIYFHPWTAVEEKCRYHTVSRIPDR